MWPDSIYDPPSLLLQYSEPFSLEKKKDPLRRWMYFGDGWKTKRNAQVLFWWVMRLGAHLQWAALFGWLQDTTQSSVNPPAAVNPHNPPADE